MGKRKGYTMIAGDTYYKKILVAIGVVVVIIVIHLGMVVHGQGISSNQLSGQIGTLSEPSCDVTFKNEEILLNPTASSIQVKMKSAEPAEVYAGYGTSPGVYTGNTPVQTTSPQGHVTININGLTQGTEYFYSVHCKRPSEPLFGTREEHSFRTLRVGDAEQFSFGMSTDSHIFTGWLKAKCE